MRNCVLFLVLLVTGYSTAWAAESMTVLGAKDNDILHDCRATAKMSVLLMKTKPRVPPAKLVEIARESLKDSGYKGSFGDADFIATFYAGAARQSGPDVDEFMARASKEELEKMEEEHEVECLKEALKDPVEK